MSCLPGNVSLIVEGGPSADVLNICKCTVPDFFLIRCFNRRGSAKVMKNMRVLHIFQQVQKFQRSCTFSKSRYVFLANVSLATASLSLASCASARTLLLRAQTSLKGPYALFADLGYSIRY